MTAKAFRPLADIPLQVWTPIPGETVKMDWEFTCSACGLVAYTERSACLGCLSCGQTMVPQSQEEYDAEMRAWAKRETEWEIVNDCGAIFDDDGNMIEPPSWWQECGLDKQAVDELKARIKEQHE